MGMFDEVRVNDIAHENFDNAHEGLIFQTKDLECEMFEYRVSGNQLLIEAERGNNGYVRHKTPVVYDFSGVAHIYTDHKIDDIEYWIKYDFTFEDGILSDVTAYDIEPTRSQKRKLFESQNQQTGIHHPLILDEFHLLTEQIINNKKG